MSLDFTENIKPWKNRSWIYTTIYSDLNSSATVMAFVNLACLIVYIRYYRIRTGNLTSATSRRTEEINQVIQDIIRINSMQIALNTRNQGGEQQNNNGNNNIGNNVQPNQEPRIEEQNLNVPEDQNQFIPRNEDNRNS